MTKWTELLVACYPPVDQFFPPPRMAVEWFTLHNATIAEAEKEARARYPEAVEVEITLGADVGIANAAAA